MDIQQLLQSKEEVPPEQQERNSSQDQENPEPPHIKEEQEELWTSQEGEQLHRLEKADITKFTFTPVPVKSEDDEKKPQSSQLHQRQTEQMETKADGEDCGGSEPARNSHPEGHLQPVIEYETCLETRDRGPGGLKVFVQQRLTAAVEEIFGHFEKTITEYEEEMNRRHRRLLDEVSKQGTVLRAADVQQLLENKEVPSEQQERSSGLDQEDPEPPHIKEEQEELWTSQEGEQLQGLEEADIIRFTYIPVPREDDEEKPQSLQLQSTGEPPASSSTEQMKTEADEDDCEGPEPVSSFDPDSYLQPLSEDETWTETRDPLSGLKALNNNIVNDNIVHKLLESEDERTDDLQDEKII
eukprot:superscaffoldBa00006060_g21089